MKILFLKLLSSFKLYYSNFAILRNKLQQFHVIHVLSFSKNSVKRQVMCLNEWFRQRCHQIKSNEMKWIVYMMRLRISKLKHIPIKMKWSIHSFVSLLWRGWAHIPGAMLRLMRPNLNNATLPTANSINWLRLHIPFIFGGKWWLAWMPNGAKFHHTTEAANKNRPLGRSVNKKNVSHYKTCTFWLTLSVTPMHVYVLEACSAVCWTTQRRFDVG